MRLYLIRHGETDLNKKGILQGQKDCELNDYGRELARITSEKLRDVPFDLIYTSPLKRALETAQIMRADRQIPLLLDSRIQEVSFGEYEGLCCANEGYNIPDPSFVDFFEHPERSKAAPGGESLQQIIKRTGEFLGDLLNNSDNRDKTILISTHGCALKGILANARDTALAGFWSQGVHKNCAITILATTDHNTLSVLEEGRIYY